MAEKYRIIPTMLFDKATEKEVINYLDGLAKQRKLGEFMVALVKAYCSHPEKFNDNVTDENKQSLDNSRNKLYAETVKQITAMKCKIDEVYKIAQKIQVSTLFGKKIGIEQQYENIMSAQFVVQRQLKELESVLGVGNVTGVFDSDRLEESKRRCEETLEFIIESYSGIVKEIKESNEVCTQLKAVPYEVVKEIVKDKSEDRSEELDVINDAPVIKIKAENKVEEVTDNDEVFGKNLDDIRRLLNYK